LDVIAYIVPKNGDILKRGKVQNTYKVMLIPGWKMSVLEAVAVNQWLEKCLNLYPVGRMVEEM
jgi:hypothetical protein